MRPSLQRQKNQRKRNPTNPSKNPSNHSQNPLRLRRGFFLMSEIRNRLPVPKGIHPQEAPHPAPSVPAVPLSRNPTVPQSRCPTVPLSHCPIVPLSHCPTVPLSHCPTVPLSHCPTVPLSHCPTVPLSRSPAVPHPSSHSPEGTQAYSRQPRLAVPDGLHQGAPKVRRQITYNQIVFSSKSIPCFVKKPLNSS